MTIIARIPGSLKEWFDGSEEAVIDGKTVGECIDQLDNKFSGLSSRLIDKNGEMSAVLIFLNGENIVNLNGLETDVADGDELGIIPLAAGG